MKVLRHATLLTMAPAYAKDGRRLVPGDEGQVEDGAIVHHDDVIRWVGADADLPPEFASLPVEDLTGHVITPGLVDAHTHLLFGGDRADEYVQRLNGVDYQQIAAAGGGILFTVRETLKLSEDQLFILGVERLERIYSYGVRTVEMKSGYALTQEGELTCLRAMKRLKQWFEGRIRLYATFLGAHAVPRHFSSSTDYVRAVVLPTLTAAHREGLVDGVDAFHEEGYFSADDTRAIFAAATKLGLRCRLHADEFKDNGGASLAVAFNALSADHLLRTGDAGIKALAASPSVATLLPGTAFFLGKPLANARGLLDAGAKVAIASDFNPGSCHCDNVLMVASFAAPALRMNQAELWAAITLNASHALGFIDQGALIPGMRASLTVFRSSRVAQITYNWGRNLAVLESV